METGIRIGGGAIRALCIAILALCLGYDAFDRQCADQVAITLRAAKPVHF